MGGNCPTHSGSLFSLPVYPGSRQSRRQEQTPCFWDGTTRTVVSEQWCQAPATTRGEPPVLVASSQHFGG